MAKLKCTNQNVANTTHQFPLIGNSSFDKDCVIEVSDNLVDDFLAIKFGWNFEVVGSKKKAKKVSNEVEDITNEEIESETPEKDAYLDGLRSLTPEELQALMSTHPEKETKKLKTTDKKIDYLVSKQFA